MENSPADLGEREQMSDTVMARNYVQDIGGKGPVQTMLERAFRELSRRFPHDVDPQNRWTRRRVRGFWNREASFVRFREMMELHQAAEAVKSEQEMLREARREHAEFIARTASLRALLERQDADFFSDQIEGLRRETGRMDRAGTED